MSSRFQGNGLAGALDRSLPQEVKELSPRMREIASIVYEKGGATVKDIQGNLHDALSVCGIRTLLLRMEKRRIVKRRRSGRHAEYIYLPTVLTEPVRQQALIKFIEDNYAGSSADTLQEILRLAH